MRFAVRFSRGGSARYMSHLDMQRMFARALRRARLPLKYSEGFNPHIVMSFASALPVGMETEGDYLEFALREYISPREILTRLAAALPPGVSATLVGALPDGEKKLMAAVASALYCVAPSDAGAFGAAMSGLLEKESLVVEKVSGEKRRLVDIRPLVLGYDGAAQRLLLALSGESSLSPALLESAIGESAAFRRLELFCEKIGRTAPLSALLEDSASVS